MTKPVCGWQCPLIESLLPNRNENFVLSVDAVNEFRYPAAFDVPFPRNHSRDVMFSENFRVFSLASSVDVSPLPISCTTLRKKNYSVFSHFILSMLPNHAIGPAAVTLFRRISRAYDSERRRCGGRWRTSQSMSWRVVWPDCHWPVSRNH